jgi:hypothetical protein
MAGLEGESACSVYYIHGSRCNTWPSNIVYKNSGA